MSIEKLKHRMFIVWDNVGMFPHFIGTYDQCKSYIAKYEGVNNGQ